MHHSFRGRGINFDLEVKVESDRKVIVKRIDSGEELSEADLDALIEEALGEAELDANVEVIVKKIVKEEIETTD